MEDIRCGKLRQRPRSYFWLKTILGLAATFSLVLLATGILAFIFYIFKINGFLNIPYFGFKGWRDFILSVPALLLALAVVFAAAAFNFLCRYPVSYRRPLIYVVGALMAIMAVGLSVIVYVTPLRRAVFYALEGSQVPVMSDFYRAYRDYHPRNLTMGRVVAITGSGIRVNTDDRETVEVVFGPQTSIYLSGGKQELEAGDYVLVHGKREGKIIGAYVVEEAGR